jgi:hypothetical protein
MTEAAGCTLGLSAGQRAIEPAEEAALRRRGFELCRGPCDPGLGEARARRQILVGRPVAEFGHQVYAAALGDQVRDLGLRIRHVTEVSGPGWAGGDAGRLALLLGQMLVVDAVDAERAFLHDAANEVQLARAVGTSPGAEAAADAHALVDQYDTVLGPLVRRACRTDRDAGRVLAMQAGLGEVHRAPLGAIAGLEGMHAVEPGPRGRGGVGVAVAERRRIAAGVPLLAVDHAGLAADAGVEINHQAETFFGTSCR